jgi:hypothetical protein
MQNKFPKALSDSGRGVSLDSWPNIGQQFYEIRGRGKFAAVAFYEVTHVIPYTRKKDGVETKIVVYKDHRGEWFSSGRVAKGLTPHGDKKPNILTSAARERAKPASPSGVGLKLRDKPRHGDVLYTGIGDDKIFLTVTDVRQRPKASPTEFVVYMQDSDGLKYFAGNNSPIIVTQ